MKNFRQSRPTAGFSLLEMMTALFVLGTGLFGTIEMYQFATERVQAMRQSEIAARAVEDQIERIRALPYDAIEAGEQTLTADDGDLDRLPGVELRVNIQPYADPELQLKEVTATLRWRGQNGRRMEKSLTTLVARKDGRR